MVEKDNKKQKNQRKEKQQIDKNLKTKKPEERLNEVLVRIFGYDIPGSRNIYTGLTKIKGVSWVISHAACIKLNIQQSKKISELSKQEIQKIEDFLTKLPIPDFLKNRRFDRDSGETKHIYGADLDITKDFDIKRLKKIKSYKGLRHALGQPVRGQRTRSHFRKKKVAMVGKRRKPEKRKV